MLCSTKFVDKMASCPELCSSMKYTLNNGTKMPAVGLGTYRIRQDSVIMKVVDYALEAGYRMFDTAAVYGNECHLKSAFNTLLPKYDLEREDIFVTTKLSPSNHGGAEITNKAYEKSLNNLGLDYIDLYLVHFPGAGGIPSSDVRNKQLRDMTWSGLEELYDSGRVNAIGVSNFTTRHLRELTSNHSIVPAVNQVEWHPYYHQQELLDFCKETDIVLQAYCSLGGTSAANLSLLKNEVVVKIAKKLQVTCAQVLLVWALQQDVAIIPKSTNSERIKQNISLNFKINDDDIKSLNALGETNIKYAWNPDVVA